jgi:hypothetical protein
MFDQLLSFFLNGNVGLYLVSILAGLFMQYEVAKANGRTNATTFFEYWLKETPGASQATIVALVAAAGTVIQSGMLVPMAAWGVIMFGFTKGYTFDAMIQSPIAPEVKS